MRVTAPPPKRITTPSPPGCGPRWRPRGGHNLFRTHVRGFRIGDVLEVEVRVEDLPPTRTRLWHAADLEGIRWRSRYDRATGILSCVVIAGEMIEGRRE